MVESTIIDRRGRRGTSRGTGTRETCRTFIVVARGTVIGDRLRTLAYIAQMRTAMTGTNQRVGMLIRLVVNRRRSGTRRGTGTRETRRTFIVIAAATIIRDRRGALAYITHMGTRMIGLN